VLLNAVPTERALPGGPSALDSPTVRAQFAAMAMGNEPVDRRRVIGILAAGLASLAVSRESGAQTGRRLITRKIPSSGEELPVVGLGTWITFNVGNDAAARDACADVMRAFFDAGGRMIDSSPMYGSAQEVIGYGLAKLRMPPALFSADKVWTSSGSGGARQIDETRRRWRVSRLDLVQVHNLLSWEEHLETLFAMKKEQRIRYVGITTSEGRRHRDIEQIMRAHPIDFVQVTYNVLDREVEERILPLARERGIGVIVNRPFRQGSLIDHVRRRPLPPWAREIDCASWAQFLLKFVVSHPAVTCAIPATSSVAHVRENIGSALGRMPDDAMRRRMIAYVSQL
jgi:diketogulonate reductase-like aldo/keto reductase